MPESQKLVSSPVLNSHSWTHPSSAPFWEAALAKLAAGEDLYPPRVIPVIVEIPDDVRLLKQVAGLAAIPKVEEVGKLTPDDIETGETVHICRLSDEAIFRLNGYIDESEICTVLIDGEPRYASKFERTAQVHIHGQLFYIATNHLIRYRL